jgi:hypothetical protein
MTASTKVLHEKRIHSDNPLQIVAFRSGIQFRVLKNPNACQTFDCRNHFSNG